MFKKLLALLLIPSLAFGQAASSVIAEKPIIQGATGVQVVVTGTGEIRFVTSADTTAKGFYIDSSTGNFTSVGGAGIATGITTGSFSPLATGTYSQGTLTNAYLNVFTNGVQAATGQNLDLRARNGNVDMYGIAADSTPLRRWRFKSTGELEQDATNGGDIVGNIASFVVRQGTTDAADTNRTWLVGGGSGSDTRGSYIIANGNEQGSTPGELRFVAGNTGSSGITFYNGGLQRWFLDTNGVWTQDSTNGSNLWMPKASTGLILGASSATRDSDITAVVASPPILTVNDNSANNAAAFIGTGNNATGVNFWSFKTRSTSGTGDANTIVQNNDSLLGIQAGGADGASYRRAAAINFEVDGTPGASDMPGRIVLQTTLDGAASPTTHWTINNVGTLVSSNITNDIGWTPVNAANQACNTTCTTGCVFGMNTGALGNFVSCSDATADTCICAGAS